jgi:hypothetical protein
MNASYSRRAGSFTEPTRDAMLGAIDQRLGRARSKPDGGATTATKAEQPREPGAVTTVEAKPREPAVRHAPVVIRVTDRGRRSWKARRSMPPRSATAGGHVRRIETEIVIKKDRTVPVGSEGNVIDRAKAAGTRFSFGPSGH